MDFKYFKISEITVALLFLTLSITAEACQQYDQKSNVSVVKHRLKFRNVWSEEIDWWNKWTMYHEYPTLYRYTVCQNTTLQTGKQLEVINGNRASVRYVLFLNCTIPIVPVGVFISFANATELYLNSSGIESVHPGAFSGMVKLEELYLHGNKLKVLERGTLNYLTNLKILDVSQNSLKVIENNSMLGLLNLQELYLGENQLAHHEFGSLSSLIHLKIVNFSCNALKHFDFKMFSSLQKLQTILLNKNRLINVTFLNATSINILDISQNYLSRIDLSFLPANLSIINFADNRIAELKNWTKLENIEDVNLGRNKIAKINNVIGTGIKMLCLSWNGIKFLNAPIFDKSESLIELDLGHNIISQIDRELFQYLVNLQSLRLNGNNIKRLPVGCLKNLTSLKSLNLSANLLTDLDFGVFDGLDNLEHLALDHNKISIIQENSFHVLGKLKTLFLDNNLIHALNVQELSQHLGNLKSISLKNNQWTCNSLFQITRAFQDHLIDVPRGDAYKKANIIGIACRNEEGLFSSSGTEVVTTSSNDEADPYYKLFQKDFKNSAFYKFFSEFTNSSFYKFFNGGFRSNSVLKYFDDNPENSVEVSRVKKSANVDKSNNVIDVFIKQNAELIKHFQTLSNRIIGFVSIMITILLVMILLFVFIFYKPVDKEKINNEPRGNCNFIRNDLELHRF